MNRFPRGRRILSLLHKFEACEFITIGIAGDQKLNGHGIRSCSCSSHSYGRPVRFHISLTHLHSKANLTSSFTASRSVLSLRRRVATTPLQRLRNNVTVQARGGFIPAEHRWMYEGVEKMGPDVWNTTYYPKADDHRNVEKKWYIVGAADKRLSRLASTIAIHIRGKNVPAFTPSIDMGAYVVVINAEKVAVTGKKREQKIYRRHSGRPGGMTEETFDNLQRRIPERIVEHVVRGMLPKGRLGRRLFTHLKVYKGSEHPHIAQQPAPLPITDKRISTAQ